jgi:hypothetical protein
LGSKAQESFSLQKKAPFFFTKHAIRKKSTPKQVADLR